MFHHIPAKWLKMKLINQILFEWLSIRSSQELNASFVVVFSHKWKEGALPNQKIGRIRQSRAVEYWDNASDFVTDTSAVSLNEAVTSPSTATPNWLVVGLLYRHQNCQCHLSAFSLINFERHRQKLNTLLIVQPHQFLQSHRGCVFAQLVIALCPSAKKKEHTTLTWCDWKWANHITKWKPRAKQEANHLSSRK